jgi:hypothetical protein
MEQQSSSERAFSEAKELARTAQFMREWSSGTQTDFTNYAARRLAERGLLREEDPIKLQRAVTEIAHSYARGGASTSGYVASESPFGPSQAPAEAIGWSTPLRTEYERRDSDTDSAALASQRAINDTSVEGRQQAAGARLGSAVRDDVTGRTEQGQRAAGGAIEQGNRQVADEARSRSENYRSTVRAGSIRSNHGGNPAVWDTVGANSSAPELGTEPKAGGRPAR